MPLLGIVSPSAAPRMLPPVLPSHGARYREQAAGRTQGQVDALEAQVDDLKLQLGESELDIVQVALVHLSLHKHLHAACSCCARVATQQADHCSKRILRLLRSSLVCRVQ